MKTKYHSILSTVEGIGGDQTRNNSMRRKWSALTLRGFFLASIFALSAPPVEAQCKQWSVGHAWRFKQGAINVDMNLQQTGNVVTGTAKFLQPQQPGGFGYGGIEARDVTGTVDGTVEGDSFAVKIYWDNNTIGVYEGTIRPSGRIEGKGWEQRSRRTKANWYSVSTMKCADAAPATPPPASTPKPIKSSGKVPTPTPKPIKSSGKTKASAAVPFINANPKAVKIPAGQSQATTTLTWDAGPDHPDAEVWIRESGGEETLVVQQAKGTRSVTVENKTYRVMLKDAGQELAVTAFFGTTP